VVLSKNGSPSAPPNGLRQAGVLVPLRVRRGEVSVVLARRTDRVPHHKGQVCFPGGSREPGDRDLLATAFREAKEELGLRREGVELLGAMDPVPTLTGFFIQPYVVRIPEESRFSLDDFEIEEVFDAPLSVFSEADRYRFAEYSTPHGEDRVYFLDYGRHTIWGATARILRRLGELTGPRAIDTVLSSCVK
jgi:8-oxo-dGTP pyrophosphatase MutT (NUDIX family)